jgi:hypothetical protein
MSNFTDGSVVLDPGAGLRARRLPEERNIVGKGGGGMQGRKRDIFAKTE